MEEKPEKKEQITTEEDLLSHAQKVVQRLEEANKKSENLIKRQEQLASSKILGGTSEAGIHKQVDKEEEFNTKLKEYFKGTAIERAINKARSLK